MLMEEVGQIGEVLAQWRAQVLDMVVLRIGSRQQDGVRWSGQRNLRVRSREDHALACQRIEIRCQAALRSKKTHAIGPGRVERDQDDVGRFRACRWSAGGFGRGGAACTQHKENKE